MGLDTALLTDPAADPSILDPWRDLAEQAGSAFLTPEWASAWFAHQGGEVSPAIVSVTSGGALVGLVPLARRGQEFRFAGYDIGDRFAPLARPGRDEDVAAAAGRLLAREVPRARFVLDNVDRDAGWTHALRASWPRRLRSERVHESVLPWIPLSGRTWDSYLADRSRNFRSQLGRRRRSLERDHDVVFRRTEAQDDVERDVKTFFALHDARWEERGGSSTAQDRVRAFHVDWARAALDRGWLRLWFLEVDGVAVASWYGWRLGDRYSYYNAGFDPAWAPRSVGLVLLAHTIAEAFGEGAAVYDMLLGDDEYKARFAESERPVESLVQARALDPEMVRTRAAAAARSAAGRLPGDLRTSLRDAVRSAGVRMPGDRGD